MARRVYAHVLNVTIANTVKSKLPAVHQPFTTVTEVLTALTAMAFTSKCAPRTSAPDLTKVRAQRTNLTVIAGGVT